MIHDTSFDFWVICDHPRDFPGHFTVRRHRVMVGYEKPVPDPMPRLALTIEAARAVVPSGLTNIGRQAEDDAVIVETWI